MAADGLVTGNGTVHSFSFSKVRKLSDGRIVGVAGVPYDMDSFCSWLEGGEKPDLNAERFEALVLQPDGTCLCYNGKLQSYPQPVPTVTGSGGEIALGAMLAGADAFTAVQIAATRDQATGGAVQVISL